MEVFFEKALESFCVDDFCLMQGGTVNSDPKKKTVILRQKRSVRLRGQTFLLLWFRQTLCFDLWCTVRVLRSPAEAENRVKDGEKEHCHPNTATTYELP